ncbi:MAG: hypothetical protein FJ031_11680, partial [Chloroflexi bacterium]|nr:hypothetical protein [Chloroflexota bacterium]
ILPKQNENDLDDVPDEIRKTMKFIFAETVDEVINAALEKKKPAKKSAAAKPKPKKTNSTKVDKDVKSKSTARRR